MQYVIGLVVSTYIIQGRFEVYDTMATEGIWDHNIGIFQAPTVATCGKGQQQIVLQSFSCVVNHVCHSIHLDGTLQAL